MLDFDTQVLIVGSGPTGLMLGCLLKRCGIDVRILDKCEQQAHESRAFGVHARSMELFHSLGLAQELLDRGLITTGLRIFVDGKLAAQLHFDDIGRSDTPFAYVLMVPQSEIESILVEDLRRLGVEVEHNVEVVDLGQDAQGVWVKAHNRLTQADMELRGSYLVGADGAHSIVRKRLGLTFEGAAYTHGFLLADCKIDWPLEYDHLTIFLRGRGLAAYLPLRGLDTGRVLVLKPSGLEPSAAQETQGSSGAELDEVEAGLREILGIPVSLSEPQWVTRYRVHHRGVNLYRLGRAFLAGDAAHIHSPAGGQGMNTGLQDAANLAWKLASALRTSEIPGLLDTYHLERWPVGQKVLKYTDTMFSGMTQQGSWTASLRNRLLPFVAGNLSKSAMVRARAFHFVSQLGIHYKTNAFLGESGKNPKGLQAGYRAPNAQIDLHRDVFSLLQGYQFHLLVLSRKALSREEIGQLAEHLAHLAGPRSSSMQTHLIAHSLIGRDPRLLRAEISQIFQAYGVADGGQALFLVRPDGYLAYCADSLNWAELATFLAKL